MALIIQLTTTSLYTSGEFSDLKIICQGHEFPVHKAILCSSSSFFRGACTVGMQEQSSGVITLHEDLAEVTVLLEFVYTGRFEVPAAKWRTWLSVLLFIVKVYVLADKYSIDLLKQKANSELQTALAAVVDEFIHIDSCNEVKEEEVWDDSSDLWIPPYKTRCVHYPMQNQWVEHILMPCIQVIYENTHDKDDLLRATVCKIEWKPYELERSWEHWADLLEQVPRYPLDYMLRCAKRH